MKTVVSIGKRSFLVLVPVLAGITWLGSGFGALQGSPGAPHLEVILRAVEESTKGVFQGEGRATLHIYEEMPDPQVIPTVRDPETGQWKQVDAEPGGHGMVRSDERFIIDFAFKGESTRIDRHSIGEDGAPQDLIHSFVDTPDIAFLYRSQPNPVLAIMHHGTSHSYRRLGHDFHPDTLIRVAESPAFPEHVGFMVKHSRTTSSSYTDEGLYQLQFDGDVYDEYAHSTVLLLDPQADYRPVEFTSEDQTDQHGSVFLTRYRARWKEYGDSWYIEDLDYEERDQYKKQTNGVARDRVEKLAVHVDKFDPTVTIDDRRFSLEEMNVSVGTPVQDTVGGLAYKYKQPPFSQADLEKPLKASGLFGEKVAAAQPPPPEETPESPKSSADEELLSSLDELVEAAVDREYVEATQQIGVHPWQVERVENMRGETIEQTIENLANFDDMLLASSSISAWAGTGSTPFHMLVVTRLARVRRLLEEGRAHPERIIPPLRRAFRESVDRFPEVHREFMRALNEIDRLWKEEGIRSPGRSEPNEYDKLRARVLAATYVLTELGDHEALPTMVESYRMWYAGILPPVPGGMTLYAMHRLVSSYPESELNAEARRLREEYLEAATCLPPPREKTVTKWNARYDESDPRVMIMDPKGVVLRKEPTMTLPVYPHRFTDGSLIASGMGRVYTRGEELFRQLERFVAAVFAEAGDAEAVPQESPKSSVHRQRLGLGKHPDRFLEEEIGKVTNCVRTRTSPFQMVVYRIIEAVGQESYNELVANLIDQNGYDYPGLMVGMGRKLPQDDIDRVLSSRRVLRLLSLLERMPREAASRECQRIFEYTLSEVKTTVERVLKKYEDPDAPENQQSLRGNKLGLCSAIFLSTRFCDAATVMQQMQAVEEYQTDVMERLVEGQGVYLKAEQVTIPLRFPDNRFKLNIFASLVLSGEGSDAGAKAEFSRYLENFSSGRIVVTAWDDSPGWYDYSWVSRGVPLDTSKRAEEITIYRWPGMQHYQHEKQEQDLERIRRFIADHGP